MSKLDKGYIQVYTGNGKGKTTAALGQVIRAAGSGLKTYFIQFMKDFPYGEKESLKRLSEFITFEQYGNDAFVFKKESPNKKLIQTVKDGLQRAEEQMLNGDYNIIVLDEVCVSIYFELFKTDEIISFLKKKPEQVEVILTGRYCPQKIMEIADLVTEMREEKHYYTEGINARKGIES